MQYAKSLILVDQSRQRNNLSSRLRMSQFKVELALGGFHALNLIENGEFDVVLIKNDQEDMSAKELVGLIRTRWDEKKLPSVVLMKNLTEEENAEIIDFGANFCFEASTDYIDVLKTLQTLVDEKVKNTKKKKGKKTVKPQK
ncbi:MAG: hypothetical protein ACPGJV_11300 [Bacteriovoracaceae bacterium]